MTEPRFTGALVTAEGLATDWADVPAPDEQDTLVLSLIVERTDGDELRFGAQWVRDAVDSPVVFVWDSQSVQQKDHEAPETAISRSGGEVRILFPRSWVDALVDSSDLHAVATATVDGVDLASTEVDVEVED